MSKKGFTYLAVTDKFNKLFQSNFKTLFTRVKDDLHRWLSLPLSLAGRINSVTMTVLPKFLYLFQCILAFIPNTFFRKLDTAVLEFIWDRKVPRLRKNVLQKPKRDGGMALPNFLYYYWAANMQPILHWMRADDNSPAWCLMESSSCAPACLSALIASIPVSVRLKTGSSMIVNSTLCIWRQFCKCIGAQMPPLCMPICKNPIFPPSTQDKAFELWFQNGIHTVRNLFVVGVFASFQQLAERFHLPNCHLFRYLQVRDCYRKRYQNFPHSQADSIFSTFSDLFQRALEPYPLMALFGILSDSTKLSKPQSDYLAFLCLITRRLFLRHWKSQHPPSHSLWIRDILAFSKLEKIRHLKRGSVSKCNELWQPFLLHVEDHDLQHPDTL